MDFLDLLVDLRDLLGDLWIAWLTTSFTIQKIYFEASWRMLLEVSKANPRVFQLYAFLLDIQKKNLND